MKLPKLSAVKFSRKALLILGVLLLINGVGNIIDDARVLTYDLTAIFAGLGFVILSRQR